MDKFSVVVADPPWTFDDKLTMSDVKRGAESHYNTLTTGQLAAVPVDFWTEKDALLALWFPASLLKDAMLVAAAWKFEIKQIYTWVKQTKNGHLFFGMGNYFRGSTEFALIGTKGKPKVTSKSMRNVELSVAMGHSTKPETLQDRLEEMFPNTRYLELFARRQRPGWTCIGNEVPGNPIDIRYWEPHKEDK